MGFDLFTTSLHQKAQYAHRGQKTRRLSTSFPTQLNGHSAVYVPSVTNNYSEKKILSNLKIKMALPFPSVNLDSKSQPASPSLLGEDELKNMQ